MCLSLIAVSREGGPLPLMLYVERACKALAKEGAIVTNAVGSGSICVAR